MTDEVGYKKPPIHTRFQKGVSGNPGGRPGPRRAVENELRWSLEAMLRQSAEVALQAPPETLIDRTAQELIEAGAKGNPRAIRIILSLLPEGGKRRRRAKLPGRLAVKPK